MATKHETIINDRSCLNKAKADEPIFVLRAHDSLADLVVRHWADLAQQAGVPKEKVEEARRCADAMQRWPDRKKPD